MQIGLWNYCISCVTIVFLSWDLLHFLLQPDLLEELFFSGLIGNVQIDSVIPYILNMQLAEYSAGQSGVQVTIRKLVLAE